MDEGLVLAFGHPVCELDDNDQRRINYPSEWEGPFRVCLLHTLQELMVLVQEDAPSSKVTWDDVVSFFGKDTDVDETECLHSLIASTLSTTISHDAGTSYSCGAIRRRQRRWIRARPLVVLFRHEPEVLREPEARRSPYHRAVSSSCLHRVYESRCRLAVLRSSIGLVHIVLRRGNVNPEQELVPARLSLGTARDEDPQIRLGLEGGLVAHNVVAVD